MRACVCVCEGVCLCTRKPGCVSGKYSNSDLSTNGIVLIGLHAALVFNGRLQMACIHTSKGHRIHADRTRSIAARCENGFSESYRMHCTFAMVIYRTLVNRIDGRRVRSNRSLACLVRNWAWVNVPLGRTNNKYIPSFDGPNAVFAVFD